MKKTILLFICACLFLLPFLAHSETLLQNGDEILFGSYEQDGNYGNGKEPICWQVLSVDEKNGTALVISKYLLDCVQYNTSTKTTKWENSTLSKWIQDTFIPEAFSEAELSLIVPTKVSGATQQVFILDQKELKKYLKSYLCSSTQYALNQGVFKSNVDGIVRSSYWVRMDKSSTWGTFVGSKGGINTKKNKVTVKDNGVRPAMYLSLDYAKDTTGASAADLKTGERITLGDMTIQITGISNADELAYYKPGITTGKASEYYASGVEAEYITIRLSIRNNASYAVDFTQGTTIELTYDNNYRFGGWVQQYPGSSSDIFLNSGDHFYIGPDETGYYCVGCTVPNSVVESTAPMFMTIHLQGEDITYYVQR